MKKTNKPLLTIFLLTYNHENTIRDTFEGIVKQQTKYPFIVKILEDCSTDNTLEICHEYVKKYPDLFILINQPKNTRGAHYRRALLNEIKTPYWCVIEGDDYYVNPSWVEKGVGFLESHQDYDTFCGAVIHKTKTYEKTMVECLNKTYEEIGHDLSFDNYIYIQTSGRMYRNTLDFSKYHQFPFASDTAIACLYLDKGKVWFEHEIMSVYRCEGAGLWSSLSPKEQAILMIGVYSVCNVMLENRHREFFRDAINKFSEPLSMPEPHGYDRLFALSIPVPFCKRKLAIGICHRGWK